MIEHLVAQGMNREQVIAYLVFQYGYPELDASMIYDIETGNSGDLVAVSEDGKEYYPNRLSMVD